MKTETREERIKRLLEARENGTLNEAAPEPKATQTSDVAREEAEDWEEESRLISSKNQERIKEASQKSAELAAQATKATVKVAEQGLVKGVAMLKAIKGKVQEKKAEKDKDVKAKSYVGYEKFRRKEEKRFADKVASETRDPDSPYIASSRFRDRLEEMIEEQQERSVDESKPENDDQEKTSKVTLPHWLTPKLAVIFVGLVIAGIGIAWFVRYEKSADSITQIPVEATTVTAPETVQVTPVEAVLPPPTPMPPTELPPLPTTAPIAVEPSTGNPAAVPVAKAAQVASGPKAQPKPIAPKEKESESQWQKDASRKLDDWGF